MTTPESIPLPTCYFPYIIFIIQTWNNHSLIEHLSLIIEDVSNKVRTNFEGGMAIVQTW